MYESRITPPPPEPGVEPIVGLFRIWRAAFERGENPRAAMSATLDHQRPSPELVPACDSFFALTQACLGRSLRSAPPGTATRSADEEGLLKTLRQIPALLALGPNAAVPHGLPGALQWAAFAVLRALDMPAEPLFGEEPRPALCPFAQPGRVPSI